MGTRRGQPDERTDPSVDSSTDAGPPGEPQWMSVQTAACELEVTTRTIYRFINDGKLTAYRIGRVYRIRRSDFVDFLADATVQPGDLDHLVDERRAGNDRAT